MIGRLIRSRRGEALRGPRRRRVGLRGAAAVSAIGALLVVGCGEEGQGPSSVPTSSSGSGGGGQASFYPPHSYADLRELARHGDAGAIRVVKSERTGLADCPGQGVDALVDPSIVGEPLATDVMAYWMSSSSHLDNDCHSAFSLFHTVAEVGNGFTAANVVLDVDPRSHVHRVELEVVRADRHLDDFRVEFQDRS